MQVLPVLNLPNISFGNYCGIYLCHHFSGVMGVGKKVIEGRDIFVDGAGWGDDIKVKK